MTRPYAPFPVNPEHPTVTSRVSAGPVPAASPFQLWRDLQLASTDRSNRVDDAVDLAFWEQIAGRYDAESSLARHVPEIVLRVVGAVGADKSVVDVGCGTGGFTIPVAEAGNRVTALDYARPMLNVLRTKLEGRPELAIRVVESKFENAEIEPHDVALAVNSLYRVVDVETAVRQLNRFARERVVVVWSVGRQPPWRRMVAERVAPGRYQPGVDYIHLVNALYHLEQMADVTVVPVDRTYRYPNEPAAIAALVDWAAPTPGEIATARTLLGEVFDRDGSGFVSHQRSHIAIMSWEPRE